MKIHELTQGSPEWLAYRRQHFNASDAPAMMGCSPYKTRSDLIHEMATGLTAEVDPATQRRFDKGHRFEAMARPLAEEIIGEELYPVVGSEGKLSASFDGLTLLQETGFEHKSLNDDLRAAMVEGCTGADLPLAYQVQMEQQCMLADSERILFMASKWANDGTLLEERHCWYTPNPDLRARIVAGWQQFEADLAAYTPQAKTVEAVGRAPEALPALRVEVTGMVTASNLDAFKAHALAVFQDINTDLQSDQDFADAEKTVKWCGEVEDRLAAAKQHALNQTESIDALFRAIDEISAQARAKRLELDKLVKNRKEAIRAEIVRDGQQAFADHVAALNARMGKPYMPTVTADFAGAIKGKRTVDSLRDAVSTELARAKIEASAVADRIHSNLATLCELAANHAFLFADTPQIVLKANDDLTALVKSRIAEHEAAEAKRLEAERERIRAEEAAKLEREQAQRAEQDRQAAARAELEAAKVNPEGAELSPAAQAINEQEGAERFAKHHPALANVVQMRQPVATPSTPPTLKLGQIGERLGFALTGEFLKNLGFEPAARDKSALLFHESQFPLICMRLVAHINHVQAKQAA